MTKTEKHRKNEVKRMQEWRRRNPEKAKRLAFKVRLRYFGLTEARYEELKKRQSNKCAICGIAQSDTPNKLHIDHDHKTGRVRGLLCLICNTRLVPAYEKYFHLMGATKAYLDKWGTL